jgi:hypothetical protein
LAAKRKILVKPSLLFQLLLPCVAEAFEMMRFNSKPEVSHMTAIWTTLGSIVKDLCMVSSEVNKEAVHKFLQTGNF